MDKIKRLRDKYERKLLALDNREQVLGILRWVAAAIAAAAFIFGAVKTVIVIVEKLQKKGDCYVEGCCDDCCGETEPDEKTISLLENAATEE